MPSRKRSNLTFLTKKINHNLFRYISRDSNYRWQYKSTTFNSMVFRVVNIPMNKHDFNKELDLIKEVYKFNGYEEN